MNSPGYFWHCCEWAPSNCNVLRAAGEVSHGSTQKSFPAKFNPIRGLTLFAHLAPPSRAAPASSASGLPWRSLSQGDSCPTFCCAKLIRASLPDLTAQFCMDLNSLQSPLKSACSIRLLERLPLSHPRWMLTVMVGTLLCCWAEIAELTRWSNLLCRSNFV